MDEPSQNLYWTECSHFECSHWRQLASSKLKTEARLRQCRSTRCCTSLGICRACLPKVVAGSRQQMTDAPRMLRQSRPGRVRLHRRLHSDTTHLCEPSLHVSAGFIERRTHFPCLWSQRTSRGHFVSCRVARDETQPSHSLDRLE